MDGAVVVQLWLHVGVRFRTAALPGSSRTPRPLHYQMKTPLKNKNVRIIIQKHYCYLKLQLFIMILVVPPSYTQAIELLARGKI